MSSVTPVFFKCRADTRLTNYEVCVAAEGVIGRGRLVGAQRIGGLWRVYLTSLAARVELLARGLHINGVRLDLLTMNPFVVYDSEGNEVPLTKLYVGDVPISYANEEIESRLELDGVRTRSRMDMEKVRTPQGKLTSWITGRRFVWIEVPKVPLSRKFDAGVFTATLFYKEMVVDAAAAECRRCLEKGHRAHECKGEEVCRGCKRPGHRVAECSGRRRWEVVGGARDVVTGTREVDREREEEAEISDEREEEEREEAEMSDEREDEKKEEGVVVVEEVEGVVMGEREDVLVVGEREEGVVVGEKEEGVVVGEKEDGVVMGEEEDGVVIGERREEESDESGESEDEYRVKQTESEDNELEESDVEEEVGKRERREEEKRQARRDEEEGRNIVKRKEKNGKVSPRTNKEEKEIKEKERNEKEEERQKKILRGRQVRRDTKGKGTLDEYLQTRSASRKRQITPDQEEKNGRKKCC